MFKIRAIISYLRVVIIWALESPAFPACFIRQQGHYRDHTLIPPPLFICTHHKIPLILVKNFYMFLASAVFAQCKFIVMQRMYNVQYTCLHIRFSKRLVHMTKIRETFRLNAPNLIPLFKILFLIE
jgi:hypothetical protein